MVHSQQWQDPDAAKGQGSNGREKEAYQREIDNADNTDISEMEKKDLAERIKDYGGSAQPGGAAPPGDTLGLAIGLATDVFKSDEAVPLTITLTNVSPNSVQANTRLFVNDGEAPPPFREVSLSITPMGSADEVEFGWDVRVGFPGSDDFSELAPDATAENTADIADLYLLEPGRYEVCASYENTLLGPTVFDEDSGEFVEQDIGAVKMSVDSDCLAFLIGPFGRQGDVDCDNDEDAVDALQTLRKTAGLGVSQNAPCPEIGSEFASLFGDVDCDGSVGAVDALKLLRSVAALSVTQTEPCPDIGDSLAPAAPASQATATGPGLPVAAAAGLAFVAFGLVGVGGAYSRRRWGDER
ncbi:MAG: hypothetical protein IH957_08685 [Chloroflexi bacterium]|nr:hypothetical protein [Chloroflexota bacterium]